ncbi:tRNA pseudouridine(55) synthase TruB [Niallia sp. 03133]|uniref:tRNA pseudouridine(55) synthase TruB n=1 Tax=Niallia sp. 03133 TaxID=3458060 RepID=UPI004044AA48
MEGILPLWKPKGMTSHDCVFKLRKILHMKRIGHTGTLDPNVDGVLPICIGRATKVAEYITDAGKTYEGEVTLGYSTTTEDSSGEIVEQKKIKETITREIVENAFQSLTGVITQTPPMYSAVKVNGKRLYEYARKGIEVERPSREVTIYSLRLLDDWDNLSGEQISFRFTVDCSKGTYIRTLAVMMGEKLGLPAHMSKLTRTRSANMTKSSCLAFAEIEEKMADGSLAEFLLPIEEAVSYLPKFQINDTLAMKVRNGSVLDTPASFISIVEPIVMESEQGEALAIYVHHPTKPGKIKPSKILKVLD